MAAKISIKTGPPVEGDDFYGRKKELQYAWDYHIEKGNSLLLSAPRRVGKSSFAKRMLKMAEEKGWKTLYLDLQGISAENEFVRLIKEKIKSANWRDKAGDLFLKMLDSIKEWKVAEITMPVDTNVWRNDTYGKIKQLIESADEILIVIDELTIFLNHLLAQENGNEKVEFFLEWLRSFRQTTKVRWILCSSVGIENFASMHRLSKHLNDLHPFEIGAFPPHEAKDFISRLSVDEKVNFSKEHIRYMLDKLVWHLPFFIQILAEKINFLICIEDKQLSNEVIDEAYNRLITENYFNTWDERLKDYNELEDTARKILKSCALSKDRSREDLLPNLRNYKSNLAKAETNLSKLLAMLINDGYLTKQNEKYLFRSPLLRDFWLYRYV
jgi:hypothetical protein